MLFSFWTEDERSGCCLNFSRGNTYHKITKKLTQEIPCYPTRAGHFSRITIAAILEGFLKPSLHLIKFSVSICVMQILHISLQNTEKNLIFWKVNLTYFPQIISKCFCMLCVHMCVCVCELFYAEAENQTLNFKKFQCLPEFQEFLNIYNFYWFLFCDFLSQKHKNMLKLKTIKKQEQRKACKFDPQRLKSKKGYKPKGLIF